jgi:type IV secretory pathway VirD2 relaxase
VVKASIVRLGGKRAAAVAHLRYLQRAGTGRDGDKSLLYGREADAIDSNVFSTRSIGDRNQFRLIVSPEDGADYDDLKPLTRRLMSRIEDDLGTTLDWCAADHFNNGHPHTHIVVRGKDGAGADLIIAPEYLTIGIRTRACELVDLDLGPRLERDIDAALQVEIERARYTPFDRALLRDAGGARIVSAIDEDAHVQTLRTRRLVKLQGLGLAEPVGAAQWRLAPDIEDTLRQIGARDDIMNMMHRELAARGIARPSSEQLIYDPAGPNARSLSGRVVHCARADEPTHHLIIDGVDGRTHIIDIGKSRDLDAVAHDMIVRIDPLGRAIHEADQRIAQIAAVNSGRYDVDAHLRFDAAATEAFAAAHVRRLEAIQRDLGGLLREPAGQWLIGDDFLTHTTAHEAKFGRDHPVAITILSTRPLHHLIEADAATWLDRDLTAPDPLIVRDAGFGAEYGAALRLRQQWLLREDLMEECGDGIRARQGMVATLQRRELLHVAGRLSAETGRSFVEAVPGMRIDGTLREPLDLISGRVALVERSREFMLAPWQRSLEGHIGSAVSGIVQETGIGWTLGRGRGLTIS